jgi:hypothetical protein
MNMIFPILNNYPDPDLDNDNMPDNWEIANGLDPDIDDVSDDPDNDRYANLDEFQAGTDPYDADSDDDGISDGGEDINHNGSVDYGESDPNNRLSPTQDQTQMRAAEAAADASYQQPQLIHSYEGRGIEGLTAVFVAVSPLPPSSFRQKSSFC